MGLSSGTLLTGTLSDFGHPDAGPGIFEFIFSLTGGEVPVDGPDLTIGVILDDQSSAFTGSFANDFSNLGLGNADTFVAGATPEPLSAAMATLALGVVGVFCTCRRGG